ncbi:MAG: DUF4406 domain-containing protein [Candidatus Paceibacterota bacterium]
MKKKTFRKCVYVSSALSGDIKRNRRLAIEYCKWTSKQGAAAYAPHVLCTIWLDDTVPEDRKEGMENGDAFLNKCDEMWAFFPKKGEYNWSKGMTSEFKQFAKEHPLQPIRMFVRIGKMKYKEVSDYKLWPRFKGVKVKRVYQDIYNAILTPQEWTGFVKNTK